MNNSIIISAKDINFVRDQRTILENINLEVRDGDFLAITGPNGGGKTTLLRLLLKLAKPTYGIIGYFKDGKPVRSLKIGYLPQKNMIDSRFPITVRQVVASGLLSEPKENKTDVASRTNDMIDLMGLGMHADKPIGNLSGGQMQRTLLGRALISNPPLLVLDEPLSYVDKQFESHIYDIMEELAGRTTIILVSHEMSRIASMANRHVIIDRTLTPCCASHHSFIQSCP